jgi:hypothetical protein
LYGACIPTVHISLYFFCLFYLRIWGDPFFASFVFPPPTPTNYSLSLLAVFFPTAANPPSQISGEDKVDNDDRNRPLGFLSHTHSLSSTRQQQPDAEANYDMNMNMTIYNHTPCS